MIEKIALIGTGVMGSTVARIIRKSGFAGSLCLADRTPELAQPLAAELNAEAVTSIEAAEAAEFIFLAVKPQVMPSLLSELAPVLAGRTAPFTLVSMAAGVTTEGIQSLAGGRYPVIRMMPDTPIAVGAGIISYCGRDVDDAALAAYTELMKPAGLVDALPENLMDAATAVSGCGPAYAYLFIEALADGGVACGLPRAKALAYAAQMVEGSARMVSATGQHPGQLKDAVCSPAGSTIEGVRALEAGGFRSAAMEAVLAAYRRTTELK